MDSPPVDPPPAEEPSFWTSFTTFTDSVATGLDELSTAITTSFEAWTAEEEATTNNEEQDYETKKREHFQKIKILEEASIGWAQKVETIWSAPPNESSIHIDVPRLVGKITIQDATGNTIFSATEGHEQSLQVLEFFTFLSKHLSDEIFQTLLTQIDLEKPVPLTNQIQAMLTDPLAAQSSSIKILKGMHQKILFPAYYNLKYLLSLPQTKDKPGTWKIILVLSNGEYFIKHRKSQIVPCWMLDSKQDSEVTAIEAEWELVIHLSEDFTLKSVTTEILQVTLTEGLVQDPFLIEHFRDNVLPKTKSQTN